MSSMMRRNSTSRPSCSAAVRRMVSLPRNILEGVSRVMNQGIELMGIGGRRHSFHHLPPNPSYPLPSPPERTTPHDEWAFLTCFEEEYGTHHPFFYACRFMEALKMAQDEHKFVFLYLHSPEHPFTAAFCRETLQSDLVIQFLDANFVSWAAIADRGEGFQMGSILRPGSFPFCAVVAPASGDNLAVLQQMEGPVSPAELVEILQRTMEEQGLAFGSSWAKEEEKRRLDRQLREEQDVAYLAALSFDQERERLKNLPLEERVQKQAKAPKMVNFEKAKQNPTTMQAGKMKESTSSRETQTQSKDVVGRGSGAQVTQILVRFPNGERREQSFQCTDKVQAIYRYIDSLGVPGVGNYRLISSFPRKVYGADQMGMTLKDAGLHPKASLFLEVL